MAHDNRLWGAERIRGELLKLGIRVARSTIQAYLQRFRTQPSPSPSWSTFLRTHASQIWACDFLPVLDLFFRPIFLFFVLELSSRRVVHFGVTRQPTDEWVAPQLREATPVGQAPRFLIRDRDRKYGPAFNCVANGSGITILKTPFRAPKANAIGERFLGSARRECLDHVLIWNERGLYRLVGEYVTYYNQARPHQGIEQKIPERREGTDQEKGGKIIAFPVLNGLHHHYRRAA